MLFLLKKRLAWENSRSLLPGSAQDRVFGNGKKKEPWITRTKTGRDKIRAGF
jgi:hypothetical protein